MNLIYLGNRWFDDKSVPVPLAGRPGAPVTAPELLGYLLDQVLMRVRGWSGDRACLATPRGKLCFKDALSKCQKAVGVFEGLLVQPTKHQMRPVGRTRPPRVRAPAPTSGRGEGRAALAVTAGAGGALFLSVCVP